MAYLRLNNPTTNSCRYEVGLSNPFTKDYYHQIRITGTNYGNPATNIDRYVGYKNPGIITIQEDQNIEKEISAGEHWYRVVFDKDGKANFFLECFGPLDADLAVYESDKRTVLGTSNNRLVDLDGDNRIGGRDFAIFAEAYKKDN